MSEKGVKESEGQRWEGEGPGEEGTKKKKEITGENGRNQTLAGVGERSALTGLEVKLPS